MPSLLDMPDVAMNLILKNSDLESIQNLRKSCRDLRNYIDDVRPETTLAVVDITLERNSVTFALSSTSSPDIIVSYRDAEKSCLLEWKTSECESESRKQKSLSNSNFIDRAFKDLQILLDFQTSRVLESLCIQLVSLHLNFHNSFLEVLKSRKHLLNTREIYMNGQSLEQVLEILQYLNPSKLEYILIQVGGDQKAFNFSEITMLEQWKCAKEVRLYSCEVDGYLEHFFHFESVSIELNELTIKMVLDLKEKFLCSPHMWYFSIDHENFNSLEQLKELFGEPFSAHYGDIWFFEISFGCQKVLQFRYLSRHIMFQRIDRKEVPESANVY